MKIYKLCSFSKWAKKEGITSAALKGAVAEIQSGLFEANLGAMVYKKRVARKGKGKSGGYRTLLAFKVDDKAIFVYGFAKNERANITATDLEGLKKLSKYYLSATTTVIDKAIKLGDIEVI